MKVGLILDLDGVICDTAHYHYLAWKELAKSYGIELTEAHNEELKGVSRVDSLKYILSLGDITLSDEQFQRDLTSKNEHYLQFVMDMGPQHLLPGVPHFFEQVNRYNLPIALGSASKNAQLVLERVGLDKQFTAIVDANTVVNGKPDPETFLKGAEMLKIAPEFCWVFEDSAAGIAAAINGGMKAVGIGTPDQLPAANYHYSNLGEFDFNLLKSSRN